MAKFVKRLSGLMAPSGDNVNAKGRAKNTMAFKIVNNKFLEQLEQTPEDQKVLVVVIKSAHNLPYTDAVSATTDPFCRVNLIQPVQDFDQLQRTSRICYTTDPVWTDGERFHLIIDDDSKVIFNLQRNFGMNSTIANALGKKKFLGDAIIKVSDITAELKEYVLPLVDPDTGQSAKNYQLVIDAKIISKEEAMFTREDVAFQYQRFKLQWHDDNLLPTDPGRYSSWDNTQYGDNFDDVTEPIPDGWSVVDGWMTLANERHGYMYGVDFPSTSWYMEKSSTVFVRRKTWTRFIARDDFAERIKAAREAVEEGNDEDGTSNENTDKDVKSAGIKSETDGSS